MHGTSAARAVPLVKSAYYSDVRKMEFVFTVRVQPNRDKANPLVEAFGLGPGATQIKPSPFTVFRENIGKDDACFNYPDTA